MKESDLDQREIQRKGGIYSKYPSSYIISIFLEKYDMKRILDLTYGKGRFYVIKKPELLVGVDVKKWEWIVEPDIFIQSDICTLPIIHGRFDAIIIDPPFPKNPNRREEYNNITVPPDRLVYSAIKIAQSLKINHVLIHYNKVLTDFDIEENIRFHYITRYLSNKGKNISYFTLYRV